MSRMTLSASGIPATFTSPGKVPIRSATAHMSPKQDRRTDPSPTNVKPINGWNNISVYRSGNLFNADKIGFTRSRYVKPSTGELVSWGSSWYASGYMPVEGNTQYVLKLACNGISDCGVAYYDSAKEFISGQATSDTKPDTLNLTTPAGASYMRFSCIEPYKNAVAVHKPGDIETYTLNFPALGKNLFNVAAYTGVATGTYSVSGDEITVKGTDMGGYPARPAMFFKAGTYTVSRTDTHGQFRYKQDEGSEVTLMAEGVSTKTFTIASDGIVRFKIGNNSTVYPFTTKIQIEEGSSATAFEPYTNTLYGGYWDPVSGVLTMTHYCVNVPYNKTWTHYTYASVDWWDLEDFDIPAPKPGAASEDICSHITPSPNGNGVNDNLYVKGTDTGQIAFGNEVCTSLNLTSSNEINAWIAAQANNGTPVQICYPIKNPKTFNVGATRLTSVSGRNAVWNSATDITDVEYDFAEPISMMKNRLKMIGNNMHLEKVSDAVAHFKADASSKVKSARMYFEPWQSFNGYGKQWPGGCGKNLLKINAQNDTINGINFIVYDSDNLPDYAGQVWIYGTATDDTEFVLNSNVSLPAGDYVLSGCPAGGSLSSYMISIDDYAVYDTGNGASFTLSSDTSGINVRIKVANGTATNSKGFTPMIRKSTETDSTFEPYANIAKIHGMDGFTLYHAGKNILNPSVGVRYNASTPEKVWGVESWSTRNTPNGTLNLQPGTYTLSISGLTGTNTPTEWRIRDSSGYIDRAYSGHLKRTFTITERKPISIYIAVKNVDNACLDNGVMLEVGSPSTIEYTPYSGYSSNETTVYLSDYNISTPVYGGYIDLMTGNVYSTYNMKKIADINWNNYSGKVIYYFTVTSSRKKGGRVLSDTLTLCEFNGFQNEKVGEIPYYPTHATYYGYFYTRLPEAMEYAQANAWIDSTYPDAYLCYEDKDENAKLVGTIDPLAINLSSGINTIWSSYNCRLEIEYWKH